MRWWLLGAVLGAALFGCTQPQRSVQALDAAGFTDISVGGYAWWACGDDSYATGFVATNPNGKRVSGAVCCGWAKNCTIRF